MDIAEPDTTEICSEQKTAEFTIHSKLGRMKKFLVYPLI